MTDIAGVKAALKGLEKTLAPIVIGPPATSLPAVRALYQIVLIRELLDGEVTSRQVAERLREWDAKNAFRTADR